MGESWYLGRGRVALLVVSLALLTIPASLTLGQGSGGDGSTPQGKPTNLDLMCQHKKNKKTF